MVRAERAMTSMGCAMAAGTEVFSLTHGHHPQRPPLSRPPVSFRGKGGELQRERRRGATYGRAKPVSIDLSWAESAHLLTSHKRPRFRHATRPNKKPPPLSNRPNSNVSHRPKRWADLVQLTDLQRFVDLKFQQVNNVFPATALHTAPSEFDCCVDEATPLKECPARRQGASSPQQSNYDKADPCRFFEDLMEKELERWADEVDIGTLAVEKWKLNKSIGSLNNSLITDLWNDIHMPQLPYNFKIHSNLHHSQHVFQKREEMT